MATEDIGMMEVLFGIHSFFDERLVSQLTKYCANPFPIASLNKGIQMSIVHDKPQKHQYDILISPDVTVKFLKNFLIKKYNLFSRDSLEFNDTILHEDRTLKSYGITEFSKIRVIPFVPPGNGKTFKMLISHPVKGAFKLDVSDEWPVDWLLHVLRRDLGVDPDGFDVMCGGKVVTDVKKKTKDYQMHQKKRVTLVGRVMGGGTTELFLYKKLFGALAAAPPAPALSFKNVLSVNGNISFIPYEKVEDVPLYPYIVGENVNCGRWKGEELVKDYSNMWFSELNLKLLVGYLDEETIQKAVCLHSYIRGAVQSDLPNKVFRSLNLDAYEVALYKGLKGRAFYLASFTSTSRTLVKGFGNWKMVFLLKPGKRTNAMGIEKLSVYQEEFEVLLNPCTKCLVYDVDEVNQVIFIIFED
eukprot:TRINITY_DN3198_c0_g1_i1.p1 TRINITY_DN3198_c0_g1~~TRINITY_DN3198_c0_g1_i1.p1  ORF type:complete len:414 (-),score=68.49 TRINITY_DN3198_c0_g1_i1:135-1376(-)